MEEPASYVTEGRFGTSTAGWAGSGPDGAVDPNLLGAHMQSRVAEAVRLQIDRREWSVADLAAALQPQGGSTTAADMLRKRLTGRTWMTITDVAQYSAVLGMEIHRAAGESLLPPELAPRVGAWRPGDGRLPTAGPVPSLDDGATTGLTEGLTTTLADWATAGGRHLIGDSLVCQLLVQQLAALGWPLAQMRIVSEPPTVDLDRPVRTSVRVVASTVDEPSFEALDEAVSRHMQALFGALGDPVHSLWVLHTRTLVAVEEEIGPLNQGTTVEIDEFWSQSTAEVAAEAGTSRPHWHIRTGTTEADIVMRWLERVK